MQFANRFKVKLNYLSPINRAKFIVAELLDHSVCPDFLLAKVGMYKVRMCNISCTCILSFY